MRILYLVLMLTAAVRSTAQQNWQVLGNFPGLARDDASGIVCNGAGYLGTGFGAGFVYLKDWWKYDFATDHWTQLTDLPGEPRQYTAIATIDHTIYLLGGITPTGCSDELWSYDVTTGQWQLVSHFPGGGRQAPVLVESNGKLFAGLGRCNTDYYKDWWVFDPGQLTWDELTSFPGEARFDPIQAKINENIFVGAGQGSAGGFKDCYTYMPRMGFWKNVPDFPGCSNFYTVQLVKDNRLLVVNGSDENYDFCVDAYEYGSGYFYNSWANWNITPLNPVRRGGVGFLHENRFYYACGLDSSSNRLNKVEYVQVDFTATSGSDDFMIYPSVTHYDLYLEAKNETDFSGNIYMYNLVGQSVQLKWPAEFTNYARLDVSALSPGIYFLKIVDKSGTKVYEYKFIKV